MTGYLKQVSYDVYWNGKKIMPHSSLEFKHVIRGNIEAIHQGLDLISALSDEQYVHIASPYVSSSIGMHFRHVVDMYSALMANDSRQQVTDIIDYDSRRRGALIEERRDIAIKELRSLEHWIMHLADAESALCDADVIEKQKQQSISVKSEVTLSDSHSVIVESSLIRELIFVSSHAVHHYALIGVIAKLQGVALSGSLGIAPATATFLREQGASSDVNTGNPTSETRMVNC